MAASFFFYYWGEPTFFLLMVTSILFNFCFGLLLDQHNKSIAKIETEDSGNNPPCNSQIKTKTTVTKKILFITALVINFSILLFYKFINFLPSDISGAFWLLSKNTDQINLVLPLAISFYTFQSVGYLIDVYRGMPSEKNPFNYALFISFFPQLLQGPILRYRDFSPQIDRQRITLNGFSDGVLRFLTGFNQKILLANILSELTEKAFNASNLSVGMAWLGMISYSLQLYFDFSGYSDMAIGLGKMFGFQFTENFDFPYASANLSEFWRRWHISLGSWFRDYLYIPLGGSRVSSKIRIALNLLIVWLATGIWHGTDFTFILWGILHGILIVFEKITGLPEKIKNKTFLQILYRGFTLFIVIFGWMLFRSEDMVQAMDYIRSLFKLNGNPWRGDMFIFNFREYYFTLIFAFISAFPIIRYIRSSISKKGKLSENTVNVVWYCIQLLLAVISLSCLAMNTHNPFLYSNF